MTSLSRRSLLRVALAAPFAGIAMSLQAKESVDDRYSSALMEQLAVIEAESGGTLGVWAFTHYDMPVSNPPLQYRANGRFPMCSTFKLMAVSALLHRSEQDKDILQQRIRYAKEDLVSYSPVTEKHIADGMTVEELCAAALQYSDNTAANLLIRLSGGPEAVTAYARSIGDEDFRLDRWEPELNTSIPGDPRDTTTPVAMAKSLQKLALGDGLKLDQRMQLQEWLQGNTTGNERIRASVPKGWMVGDKTGTGDYGTTNDIAVIWPPSRAPIVMAIYFTQKEKNAKARNDVIAKVAKLLVDALG